MDGKDDENSITNTIFFQRYPKRDKKAPIKREETAAMKEWLDIRNKIVRPNLVKLKNYIIDILPLVLAGPIVRRATRNSIWFWIALSEQITDISARIIQYDNKGTEMDYITVQKSRLKVMRAGENIWIVLCEVIPISRKFISDGYYYWL